MLRAVRGLAAAIIVGAGGLVVAAPGAATPPPSTAAAAVSPAIPAGYSRTSFIVEFAPGTAVRMSGGRLRSLNRADLSGVTRLVAGVPGARLAPLYSTSPDRLDVQTRRLEASSGTDLPDPTLYYRLRLPGRTSTSAAAALLRRLQGQPTVQFAGAEPLPRRLPTSPNLEPKQGYRRPALLGGLDADFATAVSGGTGSRVRLVDIEYSWNTAHEDLPKARATGAVIKNHTPVDPFGDTNHGTAVLGEIAASANAFGVTGLAPDVELHLINAADADGYDLADAINLGTQHLRAGDVMLIEQQIAGPNGDCGADQFGCVPVEWYKPYYDAIKAATAKGVIVVEPAANGEQNLNTTGQQPFPGGRADSGAIIVGAGAAPHCNDYPGSPRSRLYYSDYGSRVNVQGWGECVETTGYPASGVAANKGYTNDFSGTSSASPMVASAAAILSSVYANAHGVAPTPAQIRSVLVGTGQPQFTSSSDERGHIGPLPNLPDAISALTTGPRPAIASLSPASAPAGTYVTVTGTNLGSVTLARVGAQAATVRAVTDTAVAIQIPSGAADGTISLGTPTKYVTSANTFRVAPGAVVSLADGAVTHPTAVITPGQPVAFNVDAATAQRVSDQSGLGPAAGPLYDSGGDVEPNSSYVTTMRSAGTFLYAAQPGGTNGTIDVRPAVSRASGTPTTAFTLTWAAAAVSGYVYDVQVAYRPPGAATFGAFADLVGATATTATSASFVPDRGVGTYSFRARTVRPDGAADGSDIVSGYSGGSRISVPDTVAPKVRITAPANGFRRSDSITVRWSASDSGGSRLASVQVRYRTGSYRRAFSGWVQPSAWRALTRSSVRLGGLVAGREYCFSSRAVDRWGNHSAWSPGACTTVGLDDKALKAGPGWKRLAAGKYWKGSLLRATAKGARLRLGSVQVERVGIVATRCRGCGQVAISIGSKRMGTLDLGAGATGNQRSIMLPRFALRTGRLTIAVLSTGKPVQIDGIYVSRT
jgi:hypothetical protein